MTTHFNQLERVRYWQGQLLKAADLRAQVATDVELRRQHDRHLHRAVGIAIGLRAVLVEAKLELTCGMAYDCAGRALVLAQDRQLDLPAPLRAPHVLILRADPRSSTGINLAFRPASEVETTEGVALAVVRPGATEPELDPEFRPIVARPFARPHCGAGQTVPGDTNWQPWRIGQTEVGVEVTVDTSVVGFTSTPHYFGSVIAGRPDPKLPPAWFVSIADPSPTSFKLRLLLRRITRESLELVDPTAKVISSSLQNSKLTLASTAPFVQDDALSRLLPVVEGGVLVAAISKPANADVSVTLSSAIPGLTAGATLAFGSLPRVTRVSEVPDEGSSSFVTVDPLGLLGEDDVVIKWSTPPQPSRPARITRVFDDGVLELSLVVPTLAEGDTLGVVRPASVVNEVKDLLVAVAAADEFHVGDVVVRLGDDVEMSSSTTVSDKKDNTLTLASKIDGLVAGSTLGIATAATTVVAVESSTAEVVIDVPKDDVRLFQAGDLVAKLNPAGGTSAPVRVAKTSKKGQLKLHEAISGLAPNDLLGAATFGVRATVLGVSSSTVTVSNAARFPVGGFVARIDERLAPLAFAQVSGSLGNVLSLQLDGLAVGDVLALCAFPKQVEVGAIAEDGRLTLLGPTLESHETVTALPTRSGVALVAAVDATGVQLASPIQDLAVGDLLSVVDMEGTIDVKSVQGKKLTVEQLGRLRTGDVLGPLAGYRSADRSSPSALVARVDDEEVLLRSNIDGLLSGDSVGLADLRSLPGWVRLDSLPDVLPGDEVLLVGLDRLSGESISTTALIYACDQTRKRVWLYVRLGESVALRPGDVAASVLFVRGSALALIRKQELFVSWLGSEDSQPMPRPCVGSLPDDCPCASEKEP